jgi:hypothetical protein
MAEVTAPRLLIVGAFGFAALIGWSLYVLARAVAA